MHHLMRIEGSTCASSDAAPFARCSPFASKNKRYGMVEVAPKVPVGSWMPGRHLPPGARRALVLVHLALLNAVCLGEAVRGWSVASVQA